MKEDQDIISRLDRIESMLKQIALATSPASLSVDEKVRVLSSAMKRGKKALKEAERQINGL